MRNPVTFNGEIPQGAATMFHKLTEAAKKVITFMTRKVTLTVMALSAGVLALLGHSQQASATITIPAGLDPESLGTTILGQWGPYVLAIIGVSVTLTAAALILRIIRRRATGTAKS